MASGRRGHSETRKASFFDPLLVHSLWIAPVRHDPDLPPSALRAHPFPQASDLRKRRIIRQAHLVERYGDGPAAGGIPTGHARAGHALSSQVGDGGWRGVVSGSHGPLSCSTFPGFGTTDISQPLHCEHSQRRRMATSTKGVSSDRDSLSMDTALVRPHSGARHVTRRSVKPCSRRSPTVGGELGTRSALSSTTVPPDFPSFCPLLRVVQDY